jgi:shikimate kinase
LERTRRDTRRPLLQNDDPEATLINLHKDRDKLYREIADVVVATNENSVKTVANKIVSQINQG